MIDNQWGMITRQVNAQHNARTFNVADETMDKNEWQMYRENVPTIRKTSVISQGPMEMVNMTKDTTD